VVEILVTGTGKWWFSQLLAQYCV